MVPIVGQRDGTYKSVSLINALLGHKNEKCYYSLFEIIKTHAAKEHGIDISPKLTLPDFEIAVVNAVNKAFPESQ